MLNNLELMYILRSTVLRNPQEMQSSCSYWLCGGIELRNSLSGAVRAMLTCQGVKPVHCLIDTDGKVM